MADEQEVMSTDAEIMDSIGEGDESTTSKGTGEESTGETTDTTTTASTTSSEQGIDDSDEQQQQQSAAGPKDLVDAQGNVLATGGKERRFYESAQRAKGELTTATQKIEGLEAQLKAVSNAGSVGTQYNLTPEEVTTGAQMIAAYKNNPIETIKYLLTQAQASGHNIDAVSSGGTDMNAMKQMMSTALQPLISEQKERNDTQVANEKALEIYNTFKTSHPDATVHEDSLARLMQQDTSLDPEGAYLKLRNYYYERNLDWMKPLDVLQKEVGTRVENTQQALPEGNIAQGNVTDTSEVASIDTSTSDIIRAAMAEAGIT